MKYKRPLFILAGNAPYDNKGCEAIVRGTVKIIRYYFDNPRFVVLSHYRSNAQFKNQKLKELDKDIVHKKALIFYNFKPIRLFQKIALRFLYHKCRSYILYREIIPYFKDCDAVLSIGGDNYSLDYKKPTLFTDLDNLVLSKRKPIIIWGASVGPFSRALKYERYMKKHLKEVSGIFARESVTIEYLAKIGVTKNVWRVADPAFLLETIKTDRIKEKILKEAIGINLSPLMARYVTNGNLKKWIKHSADIVKEVSVKTKRPIYLISHATSPQANDYEFLKKVLFKIGKQEGAVSLIPSGLNAAETKWVISKMSVFAGARTHSVIAALSSGVPALSFAYSPKAKGINRDIYGDDCFCLGPEELTPTLVAEKIEEMIQEKTRLKKKIEANLPKIKNLTMDGGKHLKQLI